ncbi:MAG: hypothetical protein EXQ87_10980 [Alphaproteobacteria bacterium]|nr:hypothetical protein [Alphaproteobacteria bacterium]
MQQLLDFHDTILEVGGGFWVKIEARQVEPSADRPHGISYSLCLFGPDKERVVCYDNAHPVSGGRGPAKKRTAQRDHRHRGNTIRPYAFKDAETLLEDFWADVYRELGK